MILFGYRIPNFFSYSEEYYPVGVVKLLSLPINLTQYSKFLYTICSILFLISFNSVIWSTPLIIMFMILPLFIALFDKLSWLFIKIENLIK